MARNELNTLRQELDRIDNSIVDLMRQRIVVVEQVAAAKRDRDLARLAMRPAREAVIMRRLAAVADAQLPSSSLLRIWRELLAVTTQMQTAFTVTVCVPDEQPWVWDLARDHFGTRTPIQRIGAPLRALRMAADRQTDMVVLPQPRNEDLWWHWLARNQPDGLQTVLRLPFLHHDGYPVDASAYVVARLEQEPSGDDMTMLAIEAGADLSRARLREALAQAQFEPQLLATVRSDPGTADHLLEIAGFVGDNEPRLSNALTSLRKSIRRVVSLGGYPRPLTVNEDAAEADRQA